jgi:DNA-binding transcriptional regulator YhcF (GntR family)
VIVAVDPADHDPPYQQIRLQVLAAMAAGTLAVGTRLPTIRQLAADLDLATNTVARAYRELEVDGAIETRGRKGTFVMRPPKTDRATARARALDAVAQACVAEGRRLGAPAPEIAAAVARALAAPGPVT